MALGSKIVLDIPFYFCVALVFFIAGVVGTVLYYESLVVPPLEDWGQRQSDWAWYYSGQLETAEWEIYELRRRRP